MCIAMDFVGAPQRTHVDGVLQVRVRLCHVPSPEGSMVEVGHVTAAASEGVGGEGIGNVSLLVSLPATLDCLKDHLQLVLLGVSKRKGEERYIKCEC